MNTSSARFSNGFTMIELMVGMAVVSIILVAVLGIFFDIFKSDTRAKSLEELQNASYTILNDMLVETRESKSATLNTPTDITLEMQNIDPTNPDPIVKINYQLVGTKIEKTYIRQSGTSDTPIELNVQDTTSGAATQIEVSNFDIETSPSTVPLVRYTVTLVRTEPNGQALDITRSITVSTRKRDVNF